MEIRKICVTFLKKVNFIDIGPSLARSVVIVKLSNLLFIMTILVMLQSLDLGWGDFFLKWAGRGAA